MLIRLLCVLLAAVLLAGCSTSSSETASQASSDDARIGQPVRDGKFEFVVTKVDATSTPGIVQVHLTVTNIGDKSQMWSSSSQKLLAGGKEYDSDLFEGSQGIEDLNPGLGVDAVLGFKVPPGTVPEAIELHDSMFSQGVKVRL